MSAEMSIDEETSDDEPEPEDTFYRHRYNTDVDFGRVDVKGNKEDVNLENLTKIQPSGLIVGKHYLIMNEESKEKTVAVYVKFVLGDHWLGTYFKYVFRDKKGILFIDGMDHFLEKDDIDGMNYYKKRHENYDVVITEPYVIGLRFSDEFDVFLPQRSKILGKKGIKNLNAETEKYVFSFGGAKRTKRRKSYRKRKSSKKNVKKSKTRRRRR
jgi:hypothetical protein